MPQTERKACQPVRRAVDYTRGHVIGSSSSPCSLSASLSVSATSQLFSALRQRFLADTAFARCT